MDWNAIRQEYITDESTSYRKLAQKYGVGLTALYRRGHDEGWVEQRQQLKDKTAAKSIEIISDQQAERVTKYVQMTDRFTKKLEAAIEALNPRDTTSVRRVAASLRDLGDMLGIKSDADTREQEARIANLRKSADREDGQDNTVRVVVEGIPEEFKV